MDLRETQRDVCIFQAVHEKFKFFPVNQSKGGWVKINGYPSCAIAGLVNKRYMKENIGDLRLNGLWLAHSGKYEGMNELNVGNTLKYLLLKWLPRKCVCFVVINFIAIQSRK